MRVSDAEWGKNCAWCLGNLGRCCLGPQEVEVQRSGRGVRTVGGPGAGEWKLSLWASLHFAAQGWTQGWVPAQAGVHPAESKGFPGLSDSATGHAGAL